MKNVVVKRRRWLFWILVMGAGAAIFGVNAGRWLVVDDPCPADAMVVLAGETDHRPARALELLTQDYAPKVILNVPASTKIYGLTELQLAEQYVRNLPQAGAFRICSIQGLSTRDEAHDVDACLSAADKRVLIVTSDFHTRRALSIFRHEFPGRTFTAAAVRDETQFGKRWWQHRQWAKTCFYEWLRLLWWEGIERWQ